MTSTFLHLPAPARRLSPCLLALLVATVVSACGGDPPEPLDTGTPEPDWSSRLGEEERVTSLAGFEGPESVRYDPDQDVWFVGNFNGDGGERDANGFVSRVDASADTIQTLRFAVGTEAHPLHAARGMYITGDTLWVADVDGVHGFHRSTGAQLVFLDFSDFAPGFLNDISADADGVLYVTDTGRSAVYRVAGREVTEAVADTALGSPNGIVREGEGGGWILLPWSPEHRLQRWTPGVGAVAFGPATTPGRLDGAEFLDGHLILASQSDSTLQVLDPDAAESRTFVRVSGAPADIGLDVRRRRVAVPYVALDRVDIWELPPAG